MEALPNPDAPRRNKGGRPRHQPTDETRNLVRMNAGIGTPQPFIALMLGISEPTLRRYYKKEIGLGKAVAIGRACKTLYEQAVSGSNNTALLFYLKTQAGFKETNVLEHTSPQGKASPFAGLFRDGGPGQEAPEDVETSPSFHAIDDAEEET